MIAKLKDFFSRLSITEVIALGIVAVVLIVGIVMAKDKISDWWHQRKTDQFNAQMAESQKKVADLDAQNQQLRADRDKAMSSGQALQIQIDGLTAELNKYGKQAQDAVKAQQAAQDEFTKNQQAILANGTSLFDQCVDACTKFAQHGAAFACRPSVQVYCAGHSGTQ